MISKTSYAHEPADQRVDLNDPNFWSIVFKNQESKSLRLLKALDKVNLESQKQYILQVTEAVNDLIQAKLSLQGFNAEDENNITAILNSIAFRPEFLGQYRTLAISWLDEVIKPSRRFKKITQQDLDLKQQVVVEQV